MPPMRRDAGTPPCAASIDRMPSKSAILRNGGAPLYLPGTQFKTCDKNGLPACEFETRKNALPVRGKVIFQVEATNAVGGRAA